MKTVDDRESDPLIGGHIEGRYTLLGVIGRGGMGVVYEGIHDELGRHVAIKVLNAAWATDRVAVERFLREARTASSFSHGNIVDVSDLGRLPDGRPYLVMPKIDGTDLASMLYDVGPQPAKRVAELLRGVASALDVIHAKGYVHRDIKPENLMYVARDDGSETVILLDFGIAALMMSNDRRLTNQGQVFGTPHYMAPEAAMGGVTDARGDVYALATVAFELICGTLPFTSDNPMQLLSLKLVEDAPTMSSVTGLSFPAALEAVMAQGLSRDIEARYPTATELIEAIRAVTEDVPVSWQTGVLRPSMHSGEHPRGSWRDEVSRSFNLGSGGPPPQRPFSSHPSPPYSPRPSPPFSPRPSPPYSSRPPSTYSSHPSRRSPSDPAAGVPYYGPNTGDLLGAGLRESERSERYRPPRARTRWFALLGLALLAAGVVYVVRSLDDDTPAYPAAAAPAVAPPQTAAMPPPSAPPPITAPAPVAPITPTEPARPVEAAKQPPPSVPPPIAATEQLAPPIAEASKPSEPIQPAKDKSPHQKPTAHHVLAEPPPPPPMPVSEPVVVQPVVVQKEEAEPLPAPEPSGPDPNQVAQYTQSATKALLRGEVSRAVELLRQATQLDPDRALSWRSLGLALERAGDTRGAIDAYRHYLSLVPTGQQADLVRARVKALGEE